MILNTPGLLPPLNEGSLVGLKEVLVAGVRGASEAIVLCTGVLVKQGKEGTAPVKEEGDRDKGGCVRWGWVCHKACCHCTQVTTDAISWSIVKLIT